MVLPPCSSSQCLLVVYEIRKNDSLSALLQFGWEAFLYVRLALVIKMGPGIALNMAVNTTKLPFLVAAESNIGREQFLCPVIGQSEPRFETEMCKSSFVSYKKKTLRFGTIGINPYLVFDDETKTDKDGSDLRMLMMFAKRLLFEPIIVPQNSWITPCVMVSNLGFLYN